MDTSIIDRYAAGGEALRQAIAGLTDEELNAFPVPNTWSIRQIVVHLLDSDLTATHRMKRIVAEDKPLIIAYDETLFAKNLFYHEMNVELCADLFALNRAHTTELLRVLPPEAFARQGVHNQYGIISLGGMVESYARHLDHHMKFVRQKRDILAKPLAV